MTDPRVKDAAHGARVAALMALRCAGRAGNEDARKAALSALSAAYRVDHEPLTVEQALALAERTTQRALALCYASMDGAL